MDVSRRSPLFPLLAALAVVAFSFVWIVRSNNVSWRFGAPQSDHYNLLVHGFLKGQLSLDAEVDPVLARSADPYDPAVRPAGVALHDASYFRGRYYIYYGVVPAVLALLPFRVLTGVDLPIAAAVLGFALATYALMLLVLADVRRRLFPETSAMVTFVLAVACGFASCLPVLLRRSSMYELPIVSGAFFALLAIVSQYASWHSSRRRILWIAVASTAWGLAIGSRPTYLPAAASLLVCTFVLSRREASPGANRGVRFWSAALLPAALIGAGLAWYNYARFGSPTEFGLRYILSGVYESKIDHFRPRYFAWNLRAYLFATGEWGRYFPFFHEKPITAPLPRQHFGVDYPFGLLANVPLLWFAVFAVGASRAQTGPDRGAWRLLGASLTWVVVTMTVLLFCFYAAMARYLADIAPFLSILAAVGAMTLLAGVPACGRWRLRLASSVVIALCVVSVFTIGCFSTQIYRHFRANNPREFATLAKFANAPVHLLESFAGQTTGALLLDVVFPVTTEPGRRETLVQTGWGMETDRLNVVYSDSQHVIVEHEHAGAPAFVSASVAVDRESPHSLRIVMGSFRPPASWPGYAKWSDEERTAFQCRLDVSLDGTRVLHRHQRFYDGSPESLRIAGQTRGTGFSGRVVHMMRETVEASRRAASADIKPGSSGPRPTSTGEWRLTMRIPRGVPGRREPLIVGGQTGRGDFLAVEYLENQRLRFVLDHWGKRARFSLPVGYEIERDYVLEVTHPAFGMRSDDQPELLGELTVRLDGRIVWQTEVALYVISTDDIYVGENPIGGSSCANRFSGTLR